MRNYGPKAQPAVAGDPNALFWDDYDGRNCYAYALNYTETKSFNPGSLAPAKAINHRTSRCRHHLREPAARAYRARNPGDPLRCP